MSSWKFKLFLGMFFISLSAQGVDLFSGKECLDGNFQVSLQHKSSLFGFIKNRFKIVKNACEVEIHFQKYFPKKWIVDVCRSPIHIKYDNKSGLDVYKNEGDCLHQESLYCQHVEELMAIVQDNGLIFAKGEKEDIDSEHGQIYCSYLLLEQYLKERTVFSRHQGEVVLFSEKKTSKPAIKETPDLVEKAIRKQPAQPIKDDSSAEIPLKENDTDATTGTF